MSILSTVLIVLVALEFFYILYLETFATTSDATSRVFNMKKEELKGKVLDCVQAGYILNDKVIRHAKVAVGE